MGSRIGRLATTELYIALSQSDLYKVAPDLKAHGVQSTSVAALDRTAVQLGIWNIAVARMAVAISSKSSLCLEQASEFDNWLEQDNNDREGPTMAEMQDAIGRFRVWCANIGAHRKGRISLDHRLRYSERIRQTIVSLLEEFRDLLVAAFAIVSGRTLPLDEVEFSGSETSGGPEGGPEDESDETEPGYDDKTELQHISLEMREVVTCLYDLAITINRSSGRNILLKASNIDVTHFLAWDVNHVRQKFPGASPGLQTRMGESNSKRRQIFRYLSQHHAKFAHRMDERPAAQLSDQASSLTGTQISDAQGSEAEVPAPSISEARTQTAPFTIDTQTTVATVYDDDEGVIDDQVSDTTSAASDGLDFGSVLQIPDPPTGALEGRAFECPYCFEIMRVSSRRSWRLHVIRDLRPYACTFDECTEPVELFATRHAWYEHERLHRKAWVCVTCQTKHSEWSALQEHASKEHVAEDQHTVQQSTRNRSAHLMERQTSAQCPLCLHAVPDFRSHVSRHLRTLALFVLPQITEGGEEEVDSNNALASESGYTSDEDSDKAESVTSTAPGAEDDRSWDDAQAGYRGGRWADFNLQGQQGLPPLFESAGRGNLESVRLLIEDAGVDPGLLDSRGQSALSKAAEGGHIQVVNYLLTRPGLNPDQRDTVFHRTPLSWAASGGHVEVVRSLLNSPQVDVNAADNYGRTALWRAASAGHLDVVKALAEHPAVDPDVADRYGRTPFSWAAAGGHTEIVRFLASLQNVDVNSRDSGSGQTALSRAAANGRTEGVRVLSQIVGVDLNAQDNNGQTPISRAAENGHSKIISLLAQHPEVDLIKSDHAGKTPLAWARSSNSETPVGGWVCCRCSQQGLTTEIPPSWTAQCPTCGHVRSQEPCSCPEII